LGARPRLLVSPVHRRVTTPTELHRLPDRNMGVWSIFPRFDTDFVALWFPDTCSYWLMSRKDFRLSQRCSRRVRYSGKNRDLTLHVTFTLKTKNIWAYLSKSWQPPAQNRWLHDPGDHNMNLNSNKDLKSHTGLKQGCTNPGRLVGSANKFCSLAPDICS